MKLAVIKFGGRINGNADGAVGGEVLVAIDLLVKGGNEVHYYTKILDGDTPLPGAYGHQIEFFEGSSFDALVVINGNINYYGGQEPELDMRNLLVLNSFPGKIFYMMFDPMLPLKQQWESVKLKQDKYQWKNKYMQSQIEIKSNNITVISQPYDLLAVKKIWDAMGVKIKNIVHYPLYKMHLVYYDRLSHINTDRKVDLLYGGTFRNKKREDKLIKYYFGYPADFNVEIFGKIKLSDFTKKKIVAMRPPSFTGQVKATEMRNKLATGYSTVVIGDKWYEGKNLAQRIYESILGNTITFIDNDLDPKHIAYNNKLPELYVKNKKDVINFVNSCKSDPEMFKQVCDAQYEAVAIDKQEYVDNLTNLMKSLI